MSVPFSVLSKQASKHSGLAMLVGPVRGEEYATRTRTGRNTHTGGGRHVRAPPLRLIWCCHFLGTAVAPWTRIPCAAVSSAIFLSPQSHTYTHTPAHTHIHSRVQFMASCSRGSRVRAKGGNTQGKQTAAEWVSWRMEERWSSRN